MVHRGDNPNFYIINIKTSHPESILEKIIKKIIQNKEKIIILKVKMNKEEKMVKNNY